MTVTLHAHGTRTMGVVIGRFQVPELTEAHKHLLKYAIDRSEALLVVIGFPPAPPSDRNPLYWFTRKIMVQEYLENHTHLVNGSNLRIMDQMDARLDTTWSEEIDLTIKQTLSYFKLDKPALFGGRDSFIPHYCGEYQEHIHYVPYGGGLSGTETRGSLGIHCYTEGERVGYIKAIRDIGHRDRLMVDTAVMCQVGGFADSLLLGKKKGYDDFRFPGGAIDPNETTEDAASRELKEETGLDIRPTEWRVVPGGVSVPVDDWRVRGTNVTYRTNLMFAYTNPYPPEAGDDLWHVEWVPIHNIVSGAVNIVPEHQQLMTLLLNSTLLHERTLRR